jgi:hypothetical protein
MDMVCVLDKAKGMRRRRLENRTPIGLEGHDLKI